MDSSCQNLVGPVPLADNDRHRYEKKRPAQPTLRIRRARFEIGRAGSTGREMTACPIFAARALPVPRISSPL